MKKIIGLTMRLDISPQGERRLSIDSNWVRIVSNMGLIPVLMPFGGDSAQSLLERINPDAIILTGGNDILQEGPSYCEERNIFELDLLHALSKTAKPVIGICRGMQIMNLYGGGTVSPIHNHVAKDHSVTWKENLWTVNSFHNDGIPKDNLSNSFIIDALDEQGNVEAFHHKNLPWTGVMWHPERTIPQQHQHLSWLCHTLEGKSND